MSQSKLHDVLEDAALEGARELKRFLANGGKAKPEDVRRVQIALGAVKSYTQLRSSQNNMVAVMLDAAKQSGIAPDVTLSAVKAVGLLPDSITAAPIKAVK